MERSEAIEIVREYYLSSGKDLNEALEILIPELKESEDERIRKRLIEWVKEFRKLNPTNADHNAECSETIAWLEKQGEQKQAIDCLVDLSRDNWEFIHEFVEKFGRIPKDEDELNALVEYVLKRQKHVIWSEEDESIISRAISIVKWAVNSHHSYPIINKQGATELVERLESLKERCTWKPSDEQMELLREVQQALLGKDCHNRFVNFMYDLKKLRG